MQVYTDMQTKVITISMSDVVWEGLTSKFKRCCNLLFYVFMMCFFADQKFQNAQFLLKYMLGMGFRTCQSEVQLRH
jgi:hypothetical protein